MSTGQPRFRFITVPIFESLPAALNSRVWDGANVVSIRPFRSSDHGEKGEYRVNRYWSVVIDDRPASNLLSFLGLARTVTWCAILCCGFEFLRNYDQTISEALVAVLHLIIHGFK